MNILIVDDDISTVKAIQIAINWEFIGISRVETAFDAKHAREILLRQETDIVLCDIEMPMESGISLLTWARNQGLTCEFLFLTCHERFDFASEALRLGAVSYLLKPFDPTRTTEELLRAVARISAMRENHEMGQYGRLWLSNKYLIENEFWHYTLLSPSAHNAEDILSKAALSNVSLSVHDPLTLIMISAFFPEPSADLSEDSTRQVLEYRLRSAFAAALLPESDAARAVSWQRDDYFLAMCALPDKCTISEACQKVLNACQCFGNGHAVVWYAEGINICDASLTRMRMNEADRLNIARKDSIRRWSPAFSEENISDIPQPPDLLPLFSAGNKVRLLNRIREYIEVQDPCQPQTPNRLRSVQQYILQEAYVYLYQNGVQATLLFQDELSARLNAGASASLFGMMKWLSFFVDRIFDSAAQARQTSGSVELAQQFIAAHFTENITRREVAESVYLTPEYMARIFKRKTGKSISEYITHCRIEHAKKLLASCEYSIGDISVACGFSSPSYFVTVFRKATGKSPSQWRAITEEKTRF